MSQFLSDEPKYGTWTIDEDNTIERRNRIAEGFAFALVAAGYGCKCGPELATNAVELADALIAELDK